jgi:hypothetical protein
MVCLQGSDNNEAFFEKATAPNFLIIMQHMLAIPVSSIHVESGVKCHEWSVDR